MTTRNKDYSYPRVFPASTGLLPDLNVNLARQYSPPARGFSLAFEPHVAADSAFPASTGLLLLHFRNKGDLPCIPRQHGASPSFAPAWPKVGRHSPPARGCSPYRRARWFITRAFPTSAGLLRLTASPYWLPIRIPRQRGASPAACLGFPRPPSHSPPFQGFSWDLGIRYAHPPAFPASTGLLLRPILSVPEILAHSPPTRGFSFVPPVLQAPAGLPRQHGASPPHSVAKPFRSLHSPPARGYAILKDNYLLIPTIAPIELATRESPLR